MDFAEVEDLRCAGQLSGEAAVAGLPEEDKAFLDNLVRKMSSTRMRASRLGNFRIAVPSAIVCWKAKRRKVATPQPNERAVQREVAAYKPAPERVCPHFCLPCTLR